MHTTIVETKGGRKFQGILWTWRPEENYFILSGARPDSNEDLRLSFSECASIITKGQRVGINKIADEDEIGRARKHMFEGRKYGWFDKDLPKWDWE
jgi:hypothetical protein